MRQQWRFYGLSDNLPGSSVSLRQVSALRLAFGLVASLGTIIFLEGTCWDIQWHTYIGRDRTLIPPHILMLTGVTISGVAGPVCGVAADVLFRPYQDRDPDAVRAASRLL